jgi:tetratricopeptide (TPR) repeat protein
LALTLLSACAAADPNGRTTGGLGTSDVSAAVPGVAAAFLTGRFAAQHSDNEYAAQQFLRVLGSDPGNSTIRQQAFLTALLADQPEAQRLARLMPDDPAAQLLLGGVDARAGRWEQAETRFAGLPRQGGTLLLQPLLTAWAQAAQGRPEVALATLSTAPDAQRFKALFALHGAMIADLADRTQDAARLYRTAAAEFGGTNLQLARQLASWQARQGYGPEARQTLSVMLRASPDLAIAGPGLLGAVAERPVRNATDGMAEAYLTLAGALRSQDRAGFAQVLLRLALDLRPDSTIGRLLLAELYDGRNRPKQALAALAPVPANDPLAAVVRMRRAAETDKLGKTEDALAMLDALARDTPGQPEPPTLQGDILRQQKRYSDAVAAYDRAIALLPQPLPPTSWPLFYSRGISLDRAHLWARAEADFNTALELQPDQPLVLNYLGYSWTEQGRNLSRAREMVERAVKQRPNDGAITDSLGWVLLRQGDTRGAIKYLERAVELEPEDPTINGHLGDAYLAAGRKIEAQVQWRRALNLKPEADEATRLQAKLRDSGDTAEP